MAYQPFPGSIRAMQGTVPWSVIGTITGNPSISGTVNVGNFPTNQSVSGTVQVDVRGSVATVIIGGSIAASFTPPANQSVSGEVNVVQTTNPWIITGSVQGTVSILGTVPVTQAGAWSASVMTNIITSIATAGQVMGSVAALQATNPWVVVSSIAGGLFPITGSVATLQGTNPWVVNLANTSVIGYWDKVPSIVGTYSEDATHTSGDKGLFTLGVRNDAVASFVGANLEYTPHGLDSAGRSITKPFAPEEARIEGYHSVVSTSVTTLVAAAGTGLKNYITDFLISNTGANTTLVTFRSGGGTSILGYTIAPAGGGSNMTFKTPMRTLTNETFDFQATTATSILFAKVSGYKAP